MSFTPETLLRHWHTLRFIPRAPRKITARDLCDRLLKEGFSISKRSIERDLISLSQVFPLVSDERNKPFGWSWDKDAPTFDLPGINASEAFTLLLARKHLRSVMPASLLQHINPLFNLAEQQLKSLSGASALSNWLEKVRIIPATPGQLHLEYFL